MGSDLDSVPRAQVGPNGQTDDDHAVVPGTSQQGQAPLTRTEIHNLLIAMNPRDRTDPDLLSLGDVEMPELPHQHFPPNPSEVTANEQKRVSLKHIKYLFFNLFQSVRFSSYTS